MSEVQVILASASPRRAILLAQIGVTHRVVPAVLDESRQVGETIEACVLRLAEQKAQRVQAMLEIAVPVLGADTVVALEGEMLGKPRDAQHALAMLGRLSGRTHEVLSAVALAVPGGVRSRLSRSHVRFRTISRAEAERYWRSGEPQDKAGAYAIQGFGAIFVEELHGSFSGVMGLPLYETAALLAEAGVPLWRSST